jgi:hypothetical protein
MVDNSNILLLFIYIDSEGFLTAFLSVGFLYSWQYGHDGCTTQINFNNVIKQVVISLEVNMFLYCLRACKLQYYRKLSLLTYLKYQFVCKSGNRYVVTGFCDVWNDQKQIFHTAHGHGAPECPGACCLCR